MNEKWAIPGLAPITPDPWCRVNQHDAVQNRLLFKKPDPTVRGFYRQLRTFARGLFHKEFTPVPYASYLEKGDLFKWWLGRSTYSQKRKDKLTTLWESQYRHLTKRDLENDAFVKTESYEKPKHPRTIVSRSDAYKCFSGPFFALIEELAYQAPCFIKHVPVDQRADFVDRLAHHGNYKYLSSDFSSFELHMNAKMMRAVELPFYRYMLQFVPEAREFLAIHELAATAEQVLNMKYWRMRIPACRMSGDTCTSLGNGITNYVLMKFIIRYFGGRVMDAVVEGDDGLYVIDGHVPTPQECLQCGAVVELLVSDDLSCAGFCSMYFVDVDGRRVMMRDPREKLVKFGFTMSQFRFSHQRVLDELLRAAGMSLAAELGQCPIFWKVAEGVLADTCTSKPRFESDGYHTVPTRVVVRRPPACARASFESLFHVTIEDQIAIEREIEQVGLRGGRVHDLCFTPERAYMTRLEKHCNAGTPTQYAFYSGLD